MSVALAGAAVSRSSVPVIVLLMNAKRALLVTSIALVTACGSSDATEREQPSLRAPADHPPPATTTPAALEPTPTPTRPEYLALGDSIAFGYDINHRTYFADGTSEELPDQAAYAVGYPEALVGILERDAKVRVRVANTACPGEAVGSLVTGARVDDNDCFENRHKYALHYTYDHKDYDYRDGTPANENNYGAGVSQLDHAVDYLGSDPNHVKLVTITAGANDFARLTRSGCNWMQSLADVACLIGGSLSAAMGGIQNRWETMLTAIAKTGYKGPIVAVLYYSFGYGLDDLPMRTGIKVLNARIHDAAKAVLAMHPDLDLRFVESYDIFQQASSQFGDDPCNAGLLVRFEQGKQKGSCDVHPSVAGEALLAAAVWKSLTVAEQQALLATGTKVP